MKKGKTAKIIGFKTAKVTYGTVDSVNFKSIYLNIQTWVEPKKEVENWERVVLNLSRDIKHTIFNKLDKQIFEENIIVDLDLRPSGISMNKKSFSNLEIDWGLGLSLMVTSASNILSIRSEDANPFCTL